MSYRVLEVFSEEVPEGLFKKIKDFCGEAMSEDKHEARKNMHAEDWQNHKSSLLYLLMIEKRFSSQNGGMHFLFQDDKIVACSGYYRSDFDPHIFLMGVRSWTLKEHRMQLLLTHEIIPLQLEQIKQKQGKIAVVSFNEATSSFVKLIERANQKKSGKTKLFFGDRYPDFYKDMTSLDFAVNIKGAKQWILIKKIEDYNFDWKQIAYKELS